MLTIAIINRKGGVGKTSLTMHLAGAYAAKGKRVLLLDLDEQASLTINFLGQVATGQLSVSATVASLFGDAGLEPSRLPVPTAIAGIDLVPGSEALHQPNKLDPQDGAPYQMALRDLLQALAGGRDVCLIDCPPTLYFCAWCALLAADRAVVPIVPDQFGTHSLTLLKQMVGEARAWNPQLTIAGYVLNKLQPRLALHQLYEGEIRDEYGDQVLVNSVPQLADYATAGAVGQPIHAFKPKSPAARKIAAVADEVWLRAAGIPGFTVAA